MRLHMEWNEALSLCFLFAPDARSVAAIREWTSDAWALRTAPLLVLEPRNPATATAQVLQGLQQQVLQLSTVRAPVWVQLTALDDTTQSGWEAARAELLSRLNEAREWLVKSFARPLVLCLPPAWRTQVAALAPDLWHIRSYSAQVLPVTVRTHSNDFANPDAQTLQAVTQRALVSARSHLEAVRMRQNQHRTDPALQRELSLALDAWGDANAVAGRSAEALGAYRESLGIFRQLCHALGDSPQVLRDLSVSLINVGDAEGAAGRNTETLVAYRESLELCRQLRQVLGDSPQVLRDL
jgi:hypothetical protein